MQALEVKMVEWFSEHWYKITLLNGTGPDVRWMPSVTTKLGVIDKPFLAKWRGDLGNRECDMRLFEASQRGSRIHYAFNVLTTGGTVIYNPWQRPNYVPEVIKEITEKANGNVAIIQYQDEMLALVKLQKWIDIVKPEILFSEMTVYSLKNNDAGTADVGFKIKEGHYPVNGSVPLFIPGGSYIADLKTGNQVSEEANLQTSAYLHCAEEMKMGPYAGTIILHTGAKTKRGIEGMATVLRKPEEVEEDYKDYRLAAQLWERKNKDSKPTVFEFPSLIKLIQGETR